MPGGKANIKHEDGKPFSSTNQPANRGRKPRIFSQLAKEWQERGIERATPQAIAEAFEYILALPAFELRAISEKEENEADDIPMVVRLSAQELLGKRSLEILREMLDRAHGKPKQALEHSGKDGGEIEVKKTILWELPPE